jgi:O-antigen/teichoic acid export membrane protein
MESLKKPFDFYAMSLKFLLNGFLVLHTFLFIFSFFIEHPDDSPVFLIVAAIAILIGFLGSIIFLLEETSKMEFTSTLKRAGYVFLSIVLGAGLGVIIMGMQIAWIAFITAAKH